MLAANKSSPPTNRIPQQSSNFGRQITNNLFALPASGAAAAAAAALTRGNVFQTRPFALSLFGGRRRRRRNLRLPPKSAIDGTTTTIGLMTLASTSFSHFSLNYQFACAAREQPAGRAGRPINELAGKHARANQYVCQSKAASSLRSAGCATGVLGAASATGRLSGRPTGEQQRRRKEQEGEGKQRASPGSSFCWRP